MVNLKKKTKRNYSFLAFESFKVKLEVLSFSFIGKKQQQQQQQHKKYFIIVLKR
jgi:hypothetical protein